MYFDRRGVNTSPVFSIHSPRSTPHYFPSTTLISSSVSPYSLYTSWSISRSNADVSASGSRFFTRFQYPQSDRTIFNAARLAKKTGF